MGGLPALPESKRFGELLTEVRRGLRLEHAVLISVAHNATTHGNETQQHTIERTLSGAESASWMGRYGEEYADCKYLLLAPADRRIAGAVTLGRSRQCDLQVSGDSVSKLHARISVNAALGEYTITDEGSRNGTYANGLPVGDKKVALWSGSHVSLGDAHFIFMDPPTLKMLSTLDVTA